MNEELLDKMDTISDINPLVKEELGQIFSGLTDEEIKEFDGKLINSIGKKYQIPDFNIYQAKQLRDEYNHKVKFEKKVIPALDEIVTKFGKGFEIGLNMYTSREDSIYLLFKPKIDMNIKQAKKNFKKGINNIESIGAKIIKNKSTESGRYTPSKTEIKLNYKGTTFNIDYIGNPFTKLPKKAIIEMGDYINKG